MKIVKLIKWYNEDEKGYVDTMGGFTYSKVLVEGEE